MKTEKSTVSQSTNMVKSSGLEKKAQRIASLLIYDDAESMKNTGHGLIGGFADESNINLEETKGVIDADIGAYIDEELRSEKDHYDLPDYHERRREIFPEIIDALNGNEELLERTAEIMLAYFEEMVRAKNEIHG